MKISKFFLSLLLSLAAVSIIASVTEAEYFIDTDPGYGLGLEIALASNDSVSILETIDITWIIIIK